MLLATQQRSMLGAAAAHLPVMKQAHARLSTIASAQSGAPLPLTAVHEALEALGDHGLAYQRAAALCCRARDALSAVHSRGSVTNNTEMSGAGWDSLLIDDDDLTILGLQANDSLAASVTALSNCGSALLRCADDIAVCRRKLEAVVAWEVKALEPVCRATATALVGGVAPLVAHSLDTLRGALEAAEQAVDAVEGTCTVTSHDASGLEDVSLAPTTLPFIDSVLESLKETLPKDTLSSLTASALLNTKDKLSGSGEYEQRAFEAAFALVEELLLTIQRFRNKAWKATVTSLSDIETTLASASQAAEKDESDASDEEDAVDVEEDEEDFDIDVSLNFEAEHGMYQHTPIPV